jgi:hypothetical protein
MTEIINKATTITIKCNKIKIMTRILDIRSSNKSMLLIIMVNTMKCIEVEMFRTAMTLILIPIMITLTILKMISFQIITTQTAI